MHTRRQSVSSTVVVVNLCRLRCTTAKHEHAIRTISKMTAMYDGSIIHNSWAQWKTEHHSARARSNAELETAANQNSVAALIRLAQLAQLTSHSMPKNDYFTHVRTAASRCGASPSLFAIMNCAPVSTYFNCVLRRVQAVEFRASARCYVRCMSVHKTKSLHRRLASENRAGKINIVVVLLANTLAFFFSIDRAASGAGGRRRSVGRLRTRKNDVA